MAVLSYRGGFRCNGDCFEKISAKSGVIMSVGWGDEFVANFGDIIV